MPSTELPEQGLRANLDLEPPKPGQIIYNDFDILLFSPSNTCSKFKHKAYFALPDDL